LVEGTSRREDEQFMDAAIRTIIEASPIRVILSWGEARP